MVVTSSLLGLCSLAYYRAYCAALWKACLPSWRTNASSARSWTRPISREVRALSAQADVFAPRQLSRDVARMLQLYHRSWGIDGWMLLNETAGFGITHSWTDTVTRGGHVVQSQHALHLQRQLCSWQRQEAAVKIYLIENEWMQSDSDSDSDSDSVWD